MHVQSREFKNTGFLPIWVFGSQELIEHNLVDVLALLASIEARDETSGLVDRIEARHVYFFTL